MKLTIGKFSLEADLKLTFGQFSIDLNMLLRLFLPPILFICLCTGIFFVFFFLLLPLLDPILGVYQIGWAWLSLLILYIALGIAFTYFFIRFLRTSFKSAEPRTQKSMLVWSGLPFYGLCLFFLLMFVANMILNAEAPALFADLVFFILFALTSLGHFLLTRLFLRRSRTAIQS
jgi:hypothetical protein